MIPLTILNLHILFLMINLKWPNFQLALHYALHPSKIRIVLLDLPPYLSMLLAMRRKS